MNTLALFDFDNTITLKDSFTDFTVYAVGQKKFLLGLCFLSPLLIAYKLGFIKNYKAKEIVFRYFFEGWDIEQFEGMASEYSKGRLPAIIRKNAMERISWHKSQGHRIIIVSASIDAWLKDWCRLHNLELLATNFEVKMNRLTGKLLTRNCYGEEKVRRLKEKYPLEDFDYIYAYGDSTGDKEMLLIANEKYYRWKKIYD